MSWLRCPDPRPWATTRLVCFPHAGGSAVAYRTWGKAASPALEVHAVQYPGRADRIREPMMSDARQAARLIAAALAPLTDRPLALFGHSMGTILAYETALALQARGVPPAHLFLSGAPAVHLRDESGNPADKDDDALVAHLVELGGTDGAALSDPELRALVLPYVRADYRLIQKYAHRPGPRLTCPVTGLAGDADPHGTVEKVARWGELTDGAFELKAFPGDHFYLNDRQEELLAEIHGALGIPAA
ncbi:thioesterase II family protein [Actinocorallia libanotica]|uniref:Alpha/beta fold hydrolase n=1 Tax=Actinocorallia libanotica TaxID=46162 RepID=A0ABP4C4J6_9ACTN